LQKAELSLSSERVAAEPSTDLIRGRSAAVTSDGACRIHATIASHLPRIHSTVVYAACWREGGELFARGVVTNYCLNRLTIKGSPEQISAFAGDCLNLDDESITDHELLIMVTRTLRDTYLHARRRREGFEGGMGGVAQRQEISCPR
jgi:hypothetical protein